MIDEQLAIYSSLIFQWVVIAGILVAIGLFVKNRFEAIAARLNIKAKNIEEQISVTAQAVVEVETELAKVETEIEDVKTTITVGNESLVDVASKINQIVEKLNATISSLQKSKNELLSKFKFKQKGRTCVKKEKLNT